MEVPPYRLLTRGAVALAGLGEAGLRGLEDLCRSAHRDARLAGMNALFAVAEPAQRERLLAEARMDADPVIAAKAAALEGAGR